MWPSCDILWRPGPEYSLSVQLAGNQSRKISARSSWFRYHTRRSPAAHIMQSWMGEIWFPLRPFISARAKDEDKIEECFNRDSLISKQFMRSNLAAEENCSKGMSTAAKIGSDVSGTFTERDYPIEEPWLLQSSLLSSDVLTDEDNIVRFLNSDFLESMSLNQSIFENVSYYEDKNSDSHTTSSERDYPVEEPWLFQSSLLSPTSDVEVACDASSNEKSVEHETAEQEFQVPEKLFLDEESTITKALSASMDTTTWGKAHVEGSSGGLTTSQPEEEEDRVALQDSVSTIILINSSLCTMQRIAVLEDGKLVELLLEPVKNNVQCDSVYLGAVTKLVPHMGGAFVNIGSPRPSLMDIRPNRKPFIFPPFRHRTKEREANGSVVAELGEQLEIHENVHNSDDVEVIGDIEEHEIEDDALQCMRDDFEENEIEDDVDVLEDPKENLNGSVVGFGVEVDSERHSDQVTENEHHIENEIISKILPLDTGFSHDSQHSHLKDVKNSKDQESKWAHVRKGTKIIVQVVKEGLGTKGPTLTAYPKLRSRFWVLSTCCNSIGISKKISGLERTRLRVIAKALQPPGYGLTVRTVAAGHSLEELQKDLEGLLSTWKVIMENAKSAALAADEGVEGAIPVLLHRAMGQTLSVVQDYFNDKVKNMIVDSARTYHEVTNYLQDIAPDLCDRVELYNKRTPLFDEYNVEEELNNILSKRVPLSNGGYLVIEQTEALVSIDVNGGHCMLGQGTSQERAIFDVNLAAAKQIARELRLRDIGGIIVVDFIDMVDDSNKRLVYEEVKKAVERDRSMVKVSELSRHGLMEITRKRVRPSVTFMVSEPCSCCHATGRVEALETSFSKIEHEICRLLAMREQKAEPGNPKSWPKFILKVERYMCNYLTSGKRTRLAVLSSSLKVWILLKVARGFSRGTFELKPLTDDKDNKNHRVAISMLRPTTEVGAYTPKGKVTIFPIKKWKTGGK